MRLRPPLLRGPREGSSIWLLFPAPQREERDSERHGDPELPDAGLAKGAADVYAGKFVLEGSCG